jgi:hypothetical protein
MAAGPNQGGPEWVEFEKVPGPDPNPPVAETLQARRLGRERAAADSK